MKDILHFEKVFTQPVEAAWLEENKARLSVLRLDQLHDIVSGNKWFKLKNYLEDAKRKRYDSIATFGGAFSNHIIATAFACDKENFKSLGIIRGEEPPVLSHTLQTAKQYGMQLEFVNKAMYRNMEIIKRKFKDVYWVDEGGYGSLGVLGAKEILPLAVDWFEYTHIICAVGTGTMMAGIIKASNPQQRVTGISVMKENYSLDEKLGALLTGEDESKEWNIQHDFHFGGYAKHPPELINYMNEVWHQHKIPTDIVYTSKAFYATQQLISDHTIPQGSKVLMIHSGGLQGNFSLPEKTLDF